MTMIIINTCATFCQSNCHLPMDLYPAMVAALLKLKSIFFVSAGCLLLLVLSLIHLVSSTFPSYFVLFPLITHPLPFIM